MDMDTCYYVGDKEWKPTDDEDPHHSSKSLCSLGFLGKPKIVNCLKHYIYEDVWSKDIFSRRNFLFVFLQRRKNCSFSINQIKDIYLASFLETPPGFFLLLPLELSDSVDGTLRSLLLLALLLLAPPPPLCILQLWTSINYKCAIMMLWLSNDRFTDND